MTAAERPHTLSTPVVLFGVRTSTYLMQKKKIKPRVLGGGGCTPATADMDPALPLSYYSARIHSRFHQVRLELPGKLKRAPFVSSAPGGN